MTDQHSPASDQSETNAPQPALQPEEIKREAQALAARLGETQPGPISQIVSIIAVRGVEFAQEIAEESLRIDAGEGMMTSDNKRRRTIGGVFFYLARGRLTREERSTVFGTNMKGQQPSMTAHLPQFQWDEWPGILEDLFQKPGRAQRLTVQIAGRPVQVDEYEAYVALQIVHQANYPSIPRGVPAMTVGERPYTVYCQPEQWAAVKDTLDANPEETLVIDGVPGLVDGDARIYADSVMTHTVHAAKAARQRSAERQKEAAKAETGKGPAKPAAAAGPADKAKSKARKTPPATKSPVPSLADMDIPDGLPPATAQKLRELMASASVFHQKIARIEAQPEDQRFGLDMTRKLLAKVEQDIKTLLDQHSPK